MATTFNSEDIKRTALDNKLKIAILVCVDGTHNGNKYFNMYAQPDDTYMVIRGRVDVTEIIEGPYPMSKWDTHYKDKTKANKKPKPYTDQTHLFSEVVVKKDAKGKKTSNFHSNRTAAVIDFVKNLQKYANQSIEENYTVSAANVTKKQVDLAQETLNNISAMVKKGADTNAINEKLLELYQIIPRKMKRVQEHLLLENNDEKSYAGNKIKTPEDLKKAQDQIAEEQDTLDVMRGQVAIEEQEKKDGIDTPKEKEEYDLLHAMKLEVEDCTEDEIKLIKKMLDQNARSDHEKNAHLFKRAFKVKNQASDEKFEKFLAKAKNKKKELLFHGSRNENWWSIFQQGLVLRPAAKRTGSMFGSQASYFADKAQKSINYSSYSGAVRSYVGGSSNKAILAIYDVHLGDQYEITRHKSEHCDLDEAKIKKLNCDSVFAKGGYDLVNNEFIVYNEAQSAIRYLVEIGN